MHDPKVVVFDIPCPWPKRQARPFGKSRWRFHSKFWNVAGHGIYWPSLITIWHVEPGGHDSGEVCRRRSWKWHVHHWRIQVHPLQHLRRWALTRCEWCHGPSRKGDMVNHSHQWDRDRGHWWQGERGLFHRDCSTISTAHRVCLCDVGPWEHGTGGQPYGLCASCGKYRGWTKEPRPHNDEAQRILATIPEGGRDPVKMAQALALWDRHREMAGQD